MSVEITAMSGWEPGTTTSGKSYRGPKMVADRLPKSGTALLTTYGRTNKQQRQEIADALAEPGETATITERKPRRPGTRFLLVTFMQEGDGHP